MLLTRYWFITFPENRFGPGNFGVTAYSKENAKQLIIEAANYFGMQAFIENLNGKIEVIENIDIRVLDQRHIIPNMGTVTFRGVWYPNFNMH